MDNAEHNESLRRFYRENRPRMTLLPSGREVPETAEHNRLMNAKFAEFYGRPPLSHELPQIVCTAFTDGRYGGGRPDAA